MEKMYALRQLYPKQTENCLYCAVWSSNKTLITTIFCRVLPLSHSQVRTHDFIICSLEDFIVIQRRDAHADFFSTLICRFVVVGFF